MRNLHSKSFFTTWRALLNESNPGLKRDRWTCGDLDWERESHAFSGPAYAFRCEAHTLTLRRGTRVAWSLLVVVEHWWRPGGPGDVRESEWCRPLVGTGKQIVAWFRERA